MMTDEEKAEALRSLPQVDRIAVARLEPDDILVIESDAVMSQEIARRIEEAVSGVFDGRKAIVLSDGIKLRAIGHVHDDLPVTPEDVSQIIDGIENFIMDGSRGVDEIWKPYVEKLHALRQRLGKAQ